MEGDQDRELLSVSDPPSPSLSPPPRPLSLTSFDRERHVTFLDMMYHMLPYHYQSQEINHLTLAYFVVSGLDILDALDRVHKDAVADWVLSFQAHPRSKADIGNGQFYGFHGSRSSQFPSKDNAIFIQNGSHLASTYCALAILKIVGYNLSNIDSASMLTSMRSLQQSDGSFMPIHIGAERDLRFLYCAAAICFMLNNWNGMDREKAKEYILNCQSYDGGFGLTPGSESHAKQALDISTPCHLYSGSGGAAYCAIASLRLMGFIGDDCLSNASALSSKANIQSLLDWSLQRQVADGGIQGRPNKASDTCYAFWIGATMGTLGANKFIDERGLRSFLLTCQSEYGGFGKFPEELPDLYHSYFGLAAFSILGEAGLKPLCLELGVSEAAATSL